jgi:tRNA dimethylallyltransferase
LSGDVFEIISYDSVQVYRHLDIGSGKPSAGDRARVKHHCVDIVDPDCQFTAGDFCREASRALGEVRERGKVPLFVGGTGLYIDSFFSGLSEIPAVESSVRERVRADLEARGLDALYEELVECDRRFAEKIHRRDRQRIVRGLEVYRSTGTPLSDYFDQKTVHGPADTLYVGLDIDKAELHARIDRRVEEMMGTGFVDEVRSLRAMGYGPGLSPMKSIGYAELNRFIDGELSLEEAVSAIKTATKRYAKRQLTWFRKNSAIRWFEFFQVDKIKKVVYDWLES